MSETVTIEPEKVEAVIISGAHRGRIVEIASDEAEQLSGPELGALNEALDRVLSSLDRLISEMNAPTRRVESRSPSDACHA